MAHVDNVDMCHVWECVRFRVHFVGAKIQLFVKVAPMEKFVVYNKSIRAKIYFWYFWKWRTLALTFDTTELFKGIYDSVRFSFIRLIKRFQFECQPLLLIFMLILLLLFVRCRLFSFCVHAVCVCGAPCVRAPFLLASFTFRLHLRLLCDRLSVYVYIFFFVFGVM